MPRESEISNIQRSFIQNALREKIRVDGRRFDQFRNLELEFGDEYGTVTLLLGKTRYESSLAKSRDIVLTIGPQNSCTDISRSDEAAGGAQV